jgi:serine/threonine protein kinase
MTTHIAIGKPVNAAEEWAFNFLNINLPDHYYLITNVEVYDDKGHPFEVDAVVIGDYGVYMVDVKGYQGELIASKDAWFFKGRKIENPIGKLNGNARILSSRCRKKIMHGQHTPWCQATVFITGGEGGYIDIDLNGHNELPVYDQTKIINALTKPEYLSSHYDHKLLSYQKDIALKALCDFKLLQKQESMLAGYKKTTFLQKDGQVETWLVQPVEDSLQFEYWMNLVDLTGCKDSVIDDLRDRFKFEYSLLSQLADIPEVPTVLNHWDDGENLAMVFSAIHGDRLSDSILIGDTLIKVIKSLTDALLMIEDKGLNCRCLDAENLHVDDTGNVSIASVLKVIKSSYNFSNNTSSLCLQFAEIFHPMLFDNIGDNQFVENSTCLGIDGLGGWVNYALNNDEASLSDLAELFEINSDSSDLSVKQIDVESLVAGDVIADKYELKTCIGRGSTSTVWRSRHLLGEYDCSLKILKDIDGANELALSEFEVLRSSFHPNIVRIFDLDRLPGTDTFFMIGQYIDGETLCEIDSSNVAFIWTYFKNILSALQYLHRINILHKDIKPRNIIINKEKAYLIDFNLSSHESLLVGTMSYKDPLVKSRGWTKFADIYSLVVSFLEVVTGEHPFANNDELPSSGDLIALPSVIPGASDKTRNRMQQILNHEVDLEAIPDYLAWFGLSDTLDVEIPKPVSEKWDIRDGYVYKAAKSLIADDQARSRQVIVGNILKENKLVGNKTTRGSISAAISTLKTNGVVEVYGKKIRLTEDFRKSWKSLAS